MVVVWGFQVEMQPTTLSERLKAAGYGALFLRLDATAAQRSGGADDAAGGAAAAGGGMAAIFPTWRIIPVRSSG